MSEDREENSMKECDDGGLVPFQFRGSITERDILNGMAEKKGVSRGRLILDAVENQPDIPFGEIKTGLMAAGQNLDAALCGKFGRAEKLSAIAKCAGAYARLAAASGGEK